MVKLSIIFFFIFNLISFSNDSPIKLVYAQNSEAISLNPQNAGDLYSTRALFNIFDRLIEKDENLNFTPGLAEKWEQKDKNTLIFHLRKNVKFHQGQEFTSEDVKYTIEKVKESPKVRDLFESILKVETPDPYTVVIKTNESSGPLLYHLTHVSASIISKEYTEKTKVNEKHLKPNGTGPFIFDEWLVGNKLVLKKNKDYFKGAPKIDLIEIKGIPEENNRVIGLETGEVQIATEIEGIGRNVLSNNPMVNLEEISSLNGLYLGMNTSTGPLANLNIRKAIAMAIDRDAIIKFFLMDSVEKANSILAPGVFGYSKTTQPYKYNKEYAKNLLKDSGYKDITLTLTTNNNELRKQISEIIQSQLSEIGINLKIEILEWGTFLTRSGEGKTDMFMLGWANYTGDADYSLTQMLHSSNKGAQGNRTFYNNHTVDELLSKARKEIKNEKRAELYEDIQNIVNEEVPILPIYFALASAGVRKNVKGFVQTPTNIPNFYKLSLENEK